MAPTPVASILHADLDAFYASVEQLLDPSLKDRPIAVGGGVVLAASYEARAVGVHAGMPGWRARHLCPDLLFVGGHFRDYQKLGDRVMQILNDFTPLVERVSIDEAFLDVKGTVHLFGPAADIAAAIRRRVREEVGLPLSIGVATSKHLAKIASQVAKPDGMVVVEPGKETDFLGPLPVELIWGVGPATRERLARAGIFSIGELARTSSNSLERLLGIAVGDKLADLANNVDDRAVVTTRRADSMGAQAALGRRFATSSLIRSTLEYLADRVAGRLRAAGYAGRTVNVRVRFRGLRSVTRSLTLPLPVSATLTLTEIATELAHAALSDHPQEHEISLLAVSVSNLLSERGLQMELPLELKDLRHRPGTAQGAARWAVDKSVDEVRARFGREAVSYACIKFSNVSLVPEAFRQLAERGTPASGSDDNSDSVRERGGKR